MFIKLFPRRMECRRFGEGKEPHARGKKGQVGDLRGRVEGISARSRYALLCTLAEIPEMPALFVTLTWRLGLDPPDWSGWKAALRHFRSSLEYHYKEQPFSCVWRLEFTRKAVPHYHLLFFWPEIVPDVSQFRIHCWNAWLRASGQRGIPSCEQHACDVAEVENFRNCGFYLSLYASKDANYVEGKATGRCWGSWRLDQIRDSTDFFELTDEQTLIMRRTLRRKYKKVKGKNYRTPYYRNLCGSGDFQSFLTFSESYRLLRWVVNAESLLSARQCIRKTNTGS